jgi:type I restriction enzyme, S subunit
MAAPEKTKFKETEIGLIPEEWDIVNLGEIVNFSNGRTSPERFNIGKYPVYGANGVIGFSNKINSPKKSIVVGRVGSYCGSIYFSNSEAWVTDNAIKGNAKENVNSLFLYYLLNILGLNKHAGGSGQPLINQSILNSIIVQKPPQAEQKQIAKILSSLDDKIELNRKINANLEKIASALFKWWFVDIYDNTSEKSEVRLLNDVIYESVNGDWGKEQEDHDFTKKVFCIRGADISELKNGGIGKMPVRFIKEKNFINRGLRNGDIVVEISGGSPTQSTGRSVLITDELLSRFEYPLICSNFCKIIRFREMSHTGFYYTFLNDTYNRDDFFQYENGTSGIKNLDLASFFEDTNFHASDTKILEFSLFFSDIYKNIQVNGAQNNNLSIVRDSLLPRLMNGKIRVNV